jgi:hypothetical protein
VSPEVYDGTAADALEIGSARLADAIGAGFADLFELQMTREVERGLDANQRAELGKHLEKMTGDVHDVWANGNLRTALYTALREAGISTGPLLLHEGDAEAPLRWEAVPLDQVVLGQGPMGTIERVYRQFSLTLEDARRLWPAAGFSDQARRADEQSRRNGGDPAKIAVTEADELIPATGLYEYTVVEAETGHVVFHQKRAIKRWHPVRLDALAGWAHGRGPVLVVLPDIRTVNKVAELALKTASIDMVGMWQADDDGVMNVSNIQLAPGVIIPKAVGSQGLQPLQPSSRLDLAQLATDPARQRIRDRIAGPATLPPEAGVRTATEWGMRAKDTAVLLNPIYARLFLESVVPMARASVAMLARMGWFDDIGQQIGGMVRVEPRGAFRDMLRQAAAAQMVNGFAMAQALAPQTAALAIHDVEAIRHVLTAHGWPERMMRSPAEIAEAQKAQQEAHAQQMEQDPEYAQQVQAQKKTLATKGGAAA